MDETPCTDNVRQLEFLCLSFGVFSLEFSSNLPFLVYSKSEYLMPHFLNNNLHVSCLLDKIFLIIYQTVLIVYLLRGNNVYI